MVVTWGAISEVWISFTTSLQFLDEEDTVLNNHLAFALNAVSHIHESRIGLDSYLFDNATEH